jgi:hypothetical protein
MAQAIVQDEDHQVGTEGWVDDQTHDDSEKKKAPKNVKTNWTCH